MRENSATLPSITPPAGADLVCQWEDHIEGQQPYRAIYGADRHITDHDATVYSAVTQLADGTLEDSDELSPGIYVCQGDRDCLSKLNSDQARELAAALLECAAELDGWVQR
ncbi:hypothetical protein NIIDNTM18_21790 [Mycolicibacterium litorale]|uniref:Uncharacterized protein n=1 Tax=Mycolicibacterium litorale TaxID=758802 RepID=A0A6S6P5K1_9MYCO|nr:hypothetical protein [Mycolicibacterium litorale]BCI52901.1 hypothetical protein NIIDNTM18_21790 [Mycolicibacterium litorale]